MNINILFFGITSDFVGKSKVSYTINQKSTVKNLKKEITNLYPNLSNIKEFAIAVNEEYAHDDLILNDGDVVAIIPPVSGG
ncbi:MAG: molybdopterin converting factor subunit 1 [Lutibacter sp.]|uniref:molybdopterin converting factor subunit 1 n=1 Tax=Lutibacter sp. TaxID=1925666 RepID=UPI0017C6647B|nr:molybdopterin converting factor subunit 1 [Lutibacter sp.]MBT8318439.1 molybdopterin converting factor subunit 1 [Lutibacter sp.]NNJ59297.1 molybdopterin converting factor subunit 1 [Lutibacter sp.]